MAKFVVYIGPGSEIEFNKLVEFIDYHKENSFPGKIINISIESIIDEISQFSKILNDSLDSKYEEIRAKIGTEDAEGNIIQDAKDIYGNTYRPGLYRYAEITYDNLVNIKSVRLLGTLGADKIRFYFSNISNPFRVTTLKLVANKKEIVKGAREDIIENLFKCKRDAWQKDAELLDPSLPKYKHDWKWTTDNFFSPEPEYSTDKEITDSEIKRMINEFEEKNKQDKDALEKHLNEIALRKQSLIEKKKKKIEKTQTPLDWIQESLKREAKEIENTLEETGNEVGKIYQNFLDKFSIGCLIKEALECIVPKDISCRKLFENLLPTEVFNRLQIVFPKGSDTFKQIEALVQQTLMGPNITKLEADMRAEEQAINEDKVALQQFRESNENGSLDSEISNLTSKIEEREGNIANIRSQIRQQIESYTSDYNLTGEQQDRLVNGGGKLDVLLSVVEEGSGAGPQAITNAILSTIDVIIPLEELCEAIINMISFNGFEGFEGFDFPKPINPVFDPFAGLSDMVNKEFLILIATAIAQLIDGILKDLVNCDNIDNFIAQMINSGRQGEVFDPVKNLFGGRDISQIVDTNYDKFVSTIASKASLVGIEGQDVQNILNPQPGGPNTLEAIGQAAAKATIQNIPTGQFEQGVYEAQSRWDIDITGTKFETISGIEVIDFEQIDKFLDNLSNEQVQKLRNLGRVTPRALADAGFDGLAAEQITGEVGGVFQLSNEEQDEIRNKFVCFFERLTSLLMPSQVLSLLSGNPSEETVSLAHELINLCGLGYLLPNQQATSNAMANFGTITGLDNLRDEIQVLIDSTDPSTEFGINKCGPYESIEDFRLDLMGRTIQREEAEEILDQLREQRIERFNQLADQVLNLGNGQIQEGESLNVSENLKNAIKSVLDNNLSEEEKNNLRQGKPVQKNKKDPKSQINQMINDQFMGNEMVKNMLQIIKDTFFIPIENFFKQDIDSLTDAFGDIVEVEQPIQRKITVTSADGEITQEILNPEFKRLIDVGLVPIIDLDGNREYAKLVDKSSLKKFEINIPFISEDPIFSINVDNNPDSGFLPSASYDSNYPKYVISGDEASNFAEIGLNGQPIPPITNRVNKRVIGANFTKNITNTDFNVEVENEQIEIQLRGSLSVVDGGEEYLEQINSISSELTNAMNNSKPRWNLEYAEQASQFSLSLNTFGTINTTIKGSEPFYVPTFSAQGPVSVEQEIRNYMLQRYPGTEIIKTRKHVFDDIIFEGFKFLVYDRNNENFENDFKGHNTEFYTNFLSSLSDKVISGITNSRLLQSAGIEGKPELTLLETLRFAEKCKNIMGFDQLRKDFEFAYQKYLEAPEKPLTDKQIKGEEPPDSKIGNTAKIIISTIVLKIICLEYLIKSLPGFDYLKYSRDLIETEVSLRLLSDYVVFELGRLGMNNFVYDSLREMYRIGLRNPDTITHQERNEFRNKNLSYPIELRKEIINNFKDLLTQVKDIVGFEDEDKTQTSKDFLRLIIDELELTNVHNNTGFLQRVQDRETLLSDKSSDEGLLLQKYFVFPKINEDSEIVKNSGYFSESVIKSLNNLEVMNFQQAKKVIQDIIFGVGKEVDLYVCEPSPGENQTKYNNRIFIEPYQVGLRIVNYKKTTSEVPSLFIQGVEYPFKNDVCEALKAGFIQEKEKSFEVSILAEERFSVNREENSADFVNRNNDNRYMFEFYQKLKSRLLEDKEVNLLFAYSVPIKEVFNILLLHSSLSNNSPKMKYLFEPTKNIIKSLAEMLATIGNTGLSSERLRQEMEKQQRERDNVGNPAGPLSFDALKMYLRTPIQLLKGIAITSDPNIAITDKVVTGLTLAQQLLPLPEEVKKIPIPYSAISLSLLPFPIFGGLIPSIPPLTSYNVASPLGPIFLGLEPLLWDLPWFKTNNNLLGPNTVVCEDEEE